MLANRLFFFLRARHAGSRSYLSAGAAAGQPSLPLRHVHGQLRPVCSSYTGRGAPLPPPAPGAT